jgi:hypothetical protein
MNHWLKLSVRYSLRRPSVIPAPLPAPLPFDSRAYDVKSDHARAILAHLPAHSSSVEPLESQAYEIAGI